MDIYDTPLNAEQEAAYGATFKPEDSADYDMRGLYTDDPQATEKFLAGEHGPDKYKKPWHPTFSDESQYHGVAGQMGGTWGKDEGGDTFTPGSTNVQLHGLLGLIDYFDKNEPDVKLLMPRK